MIITCPSCNKKFEIDSSLIGNKGRLVQCGSCENQWFYKQTASKEPIKKFIKIKDEKNDIEVIKKREVEIKEINVEDKILKQKDKKENLIVEKNVPKKKNNYFKIFIVLVISVIAFIIIIDTFKLGLSKVIPGLDDILKNLYETLKDISLFFKDLIR